MTGGWTRWRRVWLALTLLIAGLLLAGCGGSASAPDESPGPTPTPTPWPTLRAVDTPRPVTSQPAAEAGEAGLTATPQSGPELLEQYRVAVRSDAVSIYPLSGDPEQPVRIEVIVLSGDIDPIVEVSNTNGDPLAHADTGGDGEPEVIGQLIFPTAGYYELGIASAEGEGEVGVSIYELGQAGLEGGGSFTSMDEELHASIAHPATYHTFRLPVKRGERFDLIAEAQTEGLDLLFELYNPDGVLVAARDDNEGLNPAIWNFMPDRDGPYTVVVSNYGETTGDYALRVSPSTSAGQASMGTRTEIELTGVPRRSSWLTLEGHALDAVYVEARPVDPGVDVSIAFYDGQGNELTAIDLAGAGEEETLTLVQFPFDGEYQVEFTTTAESGRIEYYIRLTRQPDMEYGGLVVAGGFGKEGEIEGPGTVYSYVFDASAGDLIGIDAHATGITGLDLGFDLYAPDGTRLLRRDDDVGINPVIDRFELPQSGRYAVTVWNYGGTTGEYDVFVTNPDAPATPPPEDVTPTAPPSESDAGG
jgi:hypothetical protein